ncbi:hypothetical protein, partial [Escherichia coli]|uniref:hypothetical protein n=1 Tax=Escherichia coli TaxID=562 RepID=UPI0019537116
RRGAACTAGLGGAAARVTTGSSTVAWRSLLPWGSAALVVTVTAVSFVLWGLNGPAYLVDLIATYCL